MSRLARLGWLSNASWTAVLLPSPPRPVMASVMYVPLATMATALAVSDWRLSRLVADGGLGFGAGDDCCAAAAGSGEAGGEVPDAVFGLVCSLMSMISCSGVGRHPVCTYHTRATDSWQADTRASLSR